MSSGFSFVNLRLSNMWFQLGHIEKVEAKDQFLDIRPPTC